VGTGSGRSMRAVGTGSGRFGAVTGIFGISWTHEQI